MSTPRATIYFLEETDFSLLFVRSVTDSPIPRIEALQEAPLTDADALTAAARTVFTTSATDVICAVRPKPGFLHLATADQAKRHSGIAGIRQFAGTHPAFASQPPAWFAAAQARDGAAPASGPWLLHAGATAHAASTLSVLEALKLKPGRSISAVVNTCGALATTLLAPTWLLEIGELSSHALLVSREGVLAAGPITLNLDRIAEAVQTELSLKFRGSAAKLFLNPDYDFSEIGSKIAARLAATLKPELATLRAANVAPTILACAGLPAGQQWFATQLAAALELAPFAPAAKSSGVSFASPELEATFSPAWFGALRFLGTAKSDSLLPWQVEWQKLTATTAPASAPVPVSTTAAAPTAPAANIAPKPPAAPAAAAPAAPTTKTPAASPAPAPAAAVKTSAPVAAPQKSSPPAATKAAAVNAPAAAKAITPSTPAPVESAVSYPPKPAVAAKQTSAPPSKKSPPPPPTGKKNSGSASSLVAAAHAVAETRASATPFPAPAPARPAASKKPLLIAIVALLIAAGAGGFFYLQSQKQAAARLAEEKARTEQRLRAEAEKTRLAQQLAEAEAGARKKAETDAAQKLAAAEAELKRAENEARMQFAARLANARGTLVVNTQPAGAMVHIAGLPPRPTPATFTDIKIGKYPVTVTLTHYEDAKLECEVKENATTDLGVISLVRLVGSLALSTEPAGVSYEVRPANTMLALPEARRSGKTPAVHDDLNPGDYTVTFTREGWSPHTENITVSRNATARANWKFADGSVAITTSPAGVTVARGGTTLGVTPLTVNEPPGAVQYVLTFDGYDPVTLSGNVEGGASLDLNATFAPADRIFTMAELDQIPQAINPKQPDLPYYLAIEKGRVELQVTLDRDGTPKSVQALNFSNRDLVKYCVAAVEKWKFKPGMKAGKPVLARIVVPVVITPHK